jgi:outer membrane autotransporter protein
MKITPCGFRTRLYSAFSLLLVAAALLGPPPASAQPIPAFLTRVGGSELMNSNLGLSAMAVQRTCGALIGLGFNDPSGSTPENELWRRCNELVATANELNMAPTGGLTRVLGYMDDDELLAAFQQVNGEEIQATADMAQNASNEQFSTIAARLGALRGATSASVTSVTANGADFMFGSGGGAAADAGAPFGPWGWFFRGTYTTGERDPSDPTSFLGQEDGFDFDQYGLTLGIDHMSGSSVWGVAVTYSSYEVEMMNRSAGAGIQTQVVSEGEIEADSVNGTFFYDHSGQNDVYFSALAGYGAQSFDMVRNFIYFADNPGSPTVVDQTRAMIATPDGDTISASLTLGRAIYRGGFVIDPHISVTYDQITIDRFAELDSGNTNSANPGAIQDGMQLAFDEQEIDSLRANIGIQFSDNINTSFGSVRPMFSFDWYHEFEDDPRAIKVKYALEDELAASMNPGPFTSGFDGCVSCFSLTSEAPDSDFFVVGAGIASAFRNGFQAFLMFEGLLDYENLDAYSVTVGFRGQF